LKHLTETTQQVPATPLSLRLTGRAVFLVSGGIDSPVAASMLISKGIVPVFAYFDNYPLCDAAAEGIAIETVRRVCAYHDLHTNKMYIIPHSPNIQMIVTKCPEKLACILSRRLMLRIAEKIAVQENCSAIVTGDSIGQKASQTLQNIAATDHVLETVTVLRPLVSMNKSQIERYARKIGTHEISIRPGVSSCGIPTQNPSTSARRVRLEKAEANLDVHFMVERALRSSRIIFV
jgi:thiamine biosynthesis protein ThiI